MPIAAALLAVQLAGQHPAFLAGRWFGQGEPYDKSEMWLAALSADGDIAVQFRTCRKGKPTDKFEKGTWRFESGIEYVRITWLDGQQVVLDETPYRILAHDAKEQTYSMPLGSMSGGFVFKSSRVDADFQMPACDLTS
jgi:hypothetical protein